MTEVALLDYGSGNLASVRFAMERLGATVRLAETADAVADAERLILPGVGAARFAMDRLKDAGLVEAIRAFPRPLLGICLGHQLLFEASEEGDTPLLGLIPGRVVRLRPGPGLTVPHTGWARLSIDRDDPLLEGVTEQSWAYFVHAYACPDGPATIARARHGSPFPAVVRTGARWGCQFHPERSSDAGAHILRNFLGLPA